jgi:hypothetical protein
MPSRTDGRMRMGTRCERGWKLEGVLLCVSATVVAALPKAAVLDAHIPANMEKSLSRRSRPRLNRQERLRWPPTTPSFQTLA